MLGRPAWDGVASLLETTVEQVSPGALLGSYKIEARLEAGDMGEVFLALDTRLPVPDSRYPSRIAPSWLTKTRKSELRAIGCPSRVSSHSIRPVLRCSTSSVDRERST